MTGFEEPDAEKGGEEDAGHNDREHEPSDDGLGVEPPLPGAAASSVRVQRPPAASATQTQAPGPGHAQAAAGTRVGFGTGLEIQLPGSQIPTGFEVRSVRTIITMKAM